jgi:branched-chain amino acid aminotransferase
MLDRAMPARADVWYDGAVLPWDDARASVLSHGIQRGALVFDVGAMRAGADGGAVLFRPREHIARFLRSAALVGLEMRWDAEALLAATLATAGSSCNASCNGRSAARAAASALVRWSAFVPTLEPDVVPRPGSLASVCVAVIAPEDSARPGEPLARKPEVVRVAVPRDLRKAGPEVFPPQAKVSASYLGPMLAKRRALADGFDEVVLLDGEGRLAEAPTANVFVVKDGVLTTPPLDRVLAGVTRDCILTLARAAGIETKEAHVLPDELADADEAFLTASSLPVQAIASFDRRPLRAPAPGPITARLKEAVLACERGEDPRYGHWAVRVGSPAVQ